MSSLAARVLRAIRRHDLLPAGERVVAAVSGGSDSVALLHLLVEMQRPAGFQIAGVAHVHHGLRERAEGDEAFVRELAGSLGLPLHAARIDARARAAAEKRSLEDAARVARYEVLHRAAAALNASRIAVGHTRDDQAETVLLKLVRGAGTRGLAGIHPRRGAVVRPLLDVGRDELRAWLAERGWPFVEDESNADVRYRRNALRHRVLPALRAHLGAGVEAVIARHAEIAREDDAALESLAAGLAERVIRSEPGSIGVDLETLNSASAALQRRVIHQALRMAGVDAPRFDGVMTVLDVAHGERAGDEAGGGIVVRRAGNRLILARSAVSEVPGDFCYELGIPGTVWVPEAGRCLGAARGTVVAAEAAARLAAGDRCAAMVNGDNLPRPLSVRSWRPGDAFRPLGLGGRKKLQDLFVDRKVPSAARRQVPLVVDAAGRIVWVAGHAIDEAYRVTAGTLDVVVLTMSQPGGPE